MKNIGSVIPLLLLLAAACKQNPATTSPAIGLEVFADSTFQAAVDSSEIAGVGVLVYQNGETLVDKGYGFASLELEVPVPEDGIFEIGSVTKQFTAVAILKLAAEGKLSLEDDFTTYVPMDTGGRQISIRALLDHTSGIPSYTEIPEFWDLSMETHPRDSLLRLVETKDFLFEPGERMIYNNTGYFLLGLIIEKVSGQDYEAYLDTNFFKPLAMNHTHYCSTEEIFQGKVYGYNYTENGLQQKAFLNHTWPYAGGSLCSTTGDMLKWTRALHGGEVLGPQEYTLLISPDTLNNGASLRYAKGLSVFNQYGNRYIGHGGGINGFLSNVRYYPESDLYIICLVNTTGPKGAGYFADELAWQLLEKQEYESIPLDLALEPLSGHFSGVVRGRVLELSVEATPDGLIIQAKGDEKADTLKTYVGNATWMDDNNRVKFQDGSWIIDQVSGYYILEPDTNNKAAE
jgi:CubicO group peptidase (beta-lactamase class C family)